MFLLATYTDGKPTENAEWFSKWLEEASTDFRYGKTYLKGLRYAVFGLGHSAYEDHFNTVTKQGVQLRSFMDTNSCASSLIPMITLKKLMVTQKPFFSWPPSRFPQVGTSVDKWLWMLSGSRVMTRGEGDCNVAKSRHGSVQADFQAWKGRLLSRLQALARGEKKSCSGQCKNGTCKSKSKKKQQGAAAEAGKCSSDQKPHSSEVSVGLELCFCQ